VPGFCSCPHPSVSTLCLPAGLKNGYCLAYSKTTIYPSKSTKTSNPESSSLQHGQQHCRAQARSGISFVRFGEGHNTQMILMDVWDTILELNQDSWSSKRAEQSLRNWPLIPSVTSCATKLYPPASPGNRRGVFTVEDENCCLISLSASVSYCFYLSTFLHRIL
jgi:hypothetical protein